MTSGCPLARYTVRMGGIVSVDWSLGEPLYDDHVCKNYDLLTAENTCKWAKVDEDEPHFARCDVALDFAQGCQMEFRFHTLVWGAEGSLPPWLQPGSPEYGNWTAEEKRQIIVDHVTEAVTHYKGRVKYYDVVNEAVCGCITWPGSGFSSCEEYVASEEGAEKCGYRVVHLVE